MFKDHSRIRSISKYERSKSDIISGVNETIRQQRKFNPNENSLVCFNIVKFNDIVSSASNNTLANVPYLTIRDYIPSGGTALYNAIGLTIHQYKDEKNIILIIATDGEENSSKHFNLNQITQMNGWNVIYLSENNNTFKQGNTIGISSSLMNCNNLVTGKKN